MLRGLAISVYILTLLSCQENKVNSSAPNPVTLFTIQDSKKTGLSFKNVIPERAHMNSMTYEYYYNGGGVSAGDINNDDLPDLFFTGNVSENKLYLNLGNFKFRDITDEVGIVDSPSWTTGSTMVDINNDDILDIYVCRSGKLPETQRANLFFVSNGRSENGLPLYMEMAAELGLADTGYSTQALFFDYDRDNDLDMYLLNHNVYVQPFYDLDKIRSTVDINVGDKLYRNEGDHFTDVSREAKIISNELGYGLGVSAGDLNGDGWADLYIANDYSEHDFLYINQGNGTFAESSKTSFRHQSNFSMGTDIADFNNDGLLDIAVLDMVAEDNYGIKASMSGMRPEMFYNQVKNGFHYQYMQNTLQLNRGNLLFSEIAQYAGVSNTDWSWAPLFMDLDLDGFQDLFITNGLKRDFRNNDYRNFKIKVLEQAESSPGVNRKKLIENLIATTPQKKLVNYVYKNINGLRFENKIKAWGIYQASFSNGLAYCDLDNDGDLDLITNNVDEEPFVYENHAANLSLGNYLKVQFEGPPDNRIGIGTQVVLHVEGTVQLRELFLTRGYQSSVDGVVHFGLGEKSPDSLVVTWPDGKSQIIKTVESNRFITISYANSKHQELPQKTVPSKLFGENTSLSFGLNFKHKENEFDDFEREVLLPHRMSRLGPGIAVGDANGDRLDDVFIGGASGQAGQIFYQGKNSLFYSMDHPALNHDKNYEDMDALFFDADNDNDNDLYVVSGGNEFDRNHDLLADRLYLNVNGSFVKDENFNSSRESGFAVRAADFDKDGDTDLLVAGRQHPGKYPFPASTKILVNNSGTFSDLSKELAPGLENIGMVTDIAWSDYDADDDLDIILVGEWMPITFFENNEGRFTKDLTVKGVDNTVGWWTSIESGDFNNDGDQDFVVGNNGLNYKYKASIKEPFSIYADDYDKNGSLDIVLGYYNEGSQFPLRGRECSSQQIPYIQKRFTTYHDFALAKLGDVYGQKNLENSLQYHVTTFASVHLENLGNKSFQLSQLPSSAQFSAINKIIATDVNGDAKLDLLIGGNNYHSEVETTRNDSSLGAILLGDGSGNFSVLDNIQSGLYQIGDLRDMAFVKLMSGEIGLVSSFNNDGLQFHLLNPQAK